LRLYDYAFFLLEFHAFHGEVEPELFLSKSDHTQVWIYTDGGCSPNPGVGGWGVVLKCPEMDLEKELSGAEARSTNNRMELTAVIRGLEALKRPCKTVVVTDSTYVADAFRKNWLGKWQRNGWKTGAKKPVKNKDLWETLVALTKKHEVTWEWVKGHADHPENERCDELATEALRQLKN